VQIGIFGSVACGENTENSDIDILYQLKTDEGWYIAHCAEVPNAHTQGSTIEEVEENLKDARKEWDRNI
jgi:predicted RNase H-like HicB family nuclease